MKKWLIAIGIFVIFIILASIYYQMIRSPLTNEEQEAVSIALAETKLEHVNSVEFYHGTDAYQVINGTDAKEEELIVWVRSDNKEVMTKRVKDGLSKEQVEQFALNELSPTEVISIRLGVEQGLPVYEITYIDGEHRYAYYYMTFDDGTFVKRYSLRNDK